MQLLQLVEDNRYNQFNETFRYLLIITQTSTL